MYDAGIPDKLIRLVRATMKAQVKFQLSWVNHLK
jgi:hypothetical protein